jgi:hypothetical protein
MDVLQDFPGKSWLGVVQVVGHLPSKCKALSSNARAEKKTLA